MAHKWPVLVAAMALAAASASANDTLSFQVIVHPGVQGDGISRASLSAVFMGKTSSWGDKTPALPVDLSTKSPIRQAFVSRVMGLSIGELQMYWLRRATRDRVFPPPIKNSDAEVLAYVAEHAGAIGYVGADTVIPEDVRVVAVLD